MYSLVHMYTYTQNIDTHFGIFQQTLFVYFCVSLSVYPLFLYFIVYHHHFVKICLMQFFLCPMVPSLQSLPTDVGLQKNSNLTTAEV